MGGNKSKPLVEQSARVVLARRAAEAAPTMAENLPKVTVNIPQATPMQTPTIPPIQVPVIPPTPPIDEHSIKVSETSSFLPQVSAPSSSKDPGALHPDILKEISKWQAVKNDNQPSSQALTKKLTKSAAQVRQERDLSIEKQIREGNVSRNVLDELQLFALCKDFRERNISIPELATKYNVDETVIQIILAHIRSPILTKDKDEPDLFIAS